LFITWRLFGSLPGAVPQEVKRVSAGRAFVVADRELDRAASGPVWLKDPVIAQCVVDALRYGESHLKLYKLEAFVVMANHVHVLLYPDAALPRITKAIKNFTARQANAILRRTGRPFWQQESFDHWVRNEKEFSRIVNYIEANPVAAGLVRNPEDWPWSSAAARSVG